MHTYDLSGRDIFTAIKIMGIKLYAIDVQKRNAVIAVFFLIHGSCENIKSAPLHMGLGEIHTFSLFCFLNCLQCPCVASIIQKRKQVCL